MIFLHKPVPILRLCIALFCYSLLKNHISKLTDTRFSNDVKKDVGKHVGKHFRKVVGKHVKKLTRFRPFVLLFVSNLGLYVLFLVHGGNLVLYQIMKPNASATVFNIRLTGVPASLL